ncbi:MAG: GLPGLI family protein [Saprospiraceae bacterium]|nr:GLPGLI family protein [Saprospiraceae bacterium]
MRYLMLLLFLGDFLPLNVLSQENADYTVFYTFQYVKDTIADSYSVPHQYILFGSQDTSFFYNYTQYQFDSIGRDFEERVGPAKDNLQLFEKVVLSQRFELLSELRVLKDFYNQHVFIVFPELGQSKFMQEPINLRWTLVSGIENVRGMACQRAETSYGGREYVAWFTDSIPIADGPYVFSGLPGLILKVEDKENWFRFEISQIIIKKQKRLRMPGFINQHVNHLMTRDEYVKQIREKKTNPKYPPGVLNITPEMKLRMQDNYKKRFDLLLEREIP